MTSFSHQEVDYINVSEQLHDLTFILSLYSIALLASMSSMKMITMCPFEMK